MRRLILSLSFSILTGLGLAQDLGTYTFPEYYRVINVAPNDVLNVRQAPSSSSPIVGELRHNAAPVEVMLATDGWGYVGLPESAGYVSLAYLEPIDLEMLGETNLPQIMTCGGTEPFWNLDFADGMANVSLMADPLVSAPVFSSGAFAGVGGSAWHFEAAEGPSSVTGIVHNRICSDGMSDTNYPREIALLVRIGGQTTGYSGCCSVRVAQ